MKIFLLLFIYTLLYPVNIPFNTSVGQAVVPNDSTYYIHKQGNIELIYTKNNIAFAKHTSKMQSSLHLHYEKLYNWSLDEKLSVGLISEKNQIANGFSTQFPHNRQINYMGGTSHIDYFTSTSWLDMLLYHETAHNYQVNVKDNPVSQFLHTLLGNGIFFIPTFTLPNLSENSFMLEGNAVLNESWHGNGGRLYNGRLYAQTLLQAKADKLQVNELYNNTVDFPYSERFYIQGGFYNLFMAEMYGLESINSYFKQHSKNWVLPFFTDYTMKLATGISFSDSIKKFSDTYRERSKYLIMAEGERIASSQFFSSLNSDNEEIFFITNKSGSRANTLVTIKKSNFNISKERNSYTANKLIKVDGKYYTQGSGHTSPTKIEQGLFDKNKFLKKGTHSKMVQGYLSDGKEVYFDVPLSYSQAQLFVDGEFYAQVNSSVFIDKNDNLYYFSQKDKKRTLYKNKIPLMRLNAYYAFVSDVDSKGSIYFIANSHYGSSLYMYKDSNVSRVSSADNIVEAKLLNDKEVILAAISDKDYYYVKTNLQSINETPYVVKHFFEDKKYFASIKEEEVQKLPTTAQEYNSFLDMRYGGLDISLFNGVNGITGSLNLKFSDSLTQNAINAFMSRDDNNISIAGLGYESALSLLRYGIYTYNVIDNSHPTLQVRNNGIIAFAELPYYKNGYYEGLLSSSFYQDYATLSREPLSLSLSFKRSEFYGKSMYLNYLNAFTLYASQDKSDTLYGAEYNFQHDLPAEVYVSLNSKYSQTNINISQNTAYSEARGVKLSTSSFSNDLDTSVIGMKSIRSNTYVKKAAYIDVGITKVLNFSSYWFTFPLSLQRESISLNYKYFNIKDFSNNTYKVKEISASLRMDIVFINNFVLPLQLSYIQNNTIFAQEKNQVFFSFTTGF